MVFYVLITESVNGSLALSGVIQRKLLYSAFQ